MPIVYVLTLEVIGIFQILTLCLILASGASQKNLIIKKQKPPLNPLSYPSNLHTGPHLWQISVGGGGGVSRPEKEARAQFYRDKICGGMLQGTEYC